MFGALGRVQKGGAEASGERCDCCSNIEVILLLLLLVHKAFNTEFFFYFRTYPFHSYKIWIVTIFFIFPTYVLTFQVHSSVHSTSLLCGFTEN